MLFFIYDFNSKSLLSVCVVLHGDAMSRERNSPRLSRALHLSSKPVRVNPE